MKNLFLLFWLGIIFLACRSGDDDLQYIDQEVNIYIESNNQDLLNTNFEESYVSISWNDVLADTDSAPVTYTKKMDLDSIFYLSYIAGATRTLVDSSENYKRYQSEIAFNITKKEIGSTTSTILDTLVLNYSSTPQLFTLESALYNGINVFNKVDGQANIIKIHK